jgi:hypothetical protein
MIGHLIYENLEIAYRVEPHPEKIGWARLVECPVDDLICRDFRPMMAPTIDEEPLPLIPSEHPTDIPIPDYQNGIIPLQSLRGVTAVIYLDFDGEEGPHQSWGDFDALPATNTTPENIFAIWQRVSEDFAPFSINVTTDLQVFLEAPENSRQRCIITPSSNASPGNGGVAFRSFNWTGDVPCWSFYSTGKSAAEVISHELGHTLGLRHHGITDPYRAYYAGHGSGAVGWAPLMGVGYYRNLTQWSRGEYNNANNSNQDDLHVITTTNNNVAGRPNDEGDDSRTAISLEIFADASVTSYGVISTGDDIDVFSFTTTGGDIALDIDPLEQGSNLDVLAELYDSQDILLQFSNPDTEIDARLAANLPAGTYFLQISGIGRGDPLGDGYTDYACLGHYSITGTITGGYHPVRLSVNENSPSGTLIGTVTPRNDHGSDPLQYAITTGNSNGAHAIDPNNGSLTIADPAPFDYESSRFVFQDSPYFELQVSIINSLRPTLNENHRIIVSLNDLNEAPIISSGSDTIIEGLRAGYEILQLSIQDPDLFDTHSCRIVSGNTGGTFQIDNFGSISIATPPDYDLAATYTLNIEVADSGTPALTVPSTVTIEILDVIPPGYQPGIIYRTRYNDIGGTSMTDFTDHSSFPFSPTNEAELSELAYLANGHNYGATVRAFLIAPHTADYTFWIASDDEGQLFLSSDQNPDNMNQIANVPGWCSPLVFDKYPSQQSAPQSLLAGQVYYLETRHKEGTSNDHVTIQWQAVSGSETLISQQTISTRYLAPHTLNYTPTITSTETADLYENVYPGTHITTFSASDINPNQSHTFSITAGDPNNIFTIDPSSGDLTVNKTGLLDADLQASLTLTVTATDNGLPARSASRDFTLNILHAETNKADKPLLEIWDDIYGLTLDSLYSNPDWPEFPDRVRELNQFELATSIGSNYGARIRVYLTPTTSGEYHFYIASDDQGRLLMSPDDSIENATQIAYVTDWCRYHIWDKYPEQKSAAINLVAGERYFMEARLKEALSNDHISIAWTGPGIPDITVISNDFLTPYDSNTAPTFGSSQYNFTLDANVTAGTVLGTINATSQAFETIKYVILSSDDRSVFAIDPNTGQLSLQDPSALIPGQIFNLTVGSQDDGYGGHFPPKESSVPLTLSVSGTPLQTWRGLHFSNDLTNTQLTGNLMDPDQDSINNLIEYALNLDPNKTDSPDDLPIISSKSNTLKFTYRKNLSATDLNYNIQQATDLSATTPWSSAQITNEETLSDDGSTRLIRATLSNSASSPMRFIRLQVEIK